MSETQQQQRQYRRVANLRIKVAKYPLDAVLQQKLATAQDKAQFLDDFEQELKEIM